MPESWFECTTMFWFFCMYRCLSEFTVYLFFFFFLFQTLMTTTWRWRPSDHGQLTNQGSSRHRQVSQHDGWSLIIIEGSTWIIGGHVLPCQLLWLTFDLGASDNAHNWWRCKKRGWIIHQTLHFIFQLVSHSVYLKNPPDMHMTWHVDCVTHISASHML